jgi:phenylpropionate dioxygenase-like ring-hydroxylating dioxygenase large terminal subunit
MFVRNAWYCAGWDYDFSLTKSRLVAREIAGELIMLYRKSDGQVVAMEDRCPHRKAALSLGIKEGDAVRCGYHGLKFGPDGRCLEIPGQDKIPDRAAVRTYPVAEKDNWVWVWMGEPPQADPSLICFAVGPSAPGWVIKTDTMAVNTNYRCEIANLMDLSHATYVHAQTLGGTDAWATTKVNTTLLERAVRNDFVLRSVPPLPFTRHLFPQGTLIDIDVEFTCTIPCNWILHFRAYTAGTAIAGPPNGKLILDSWSCQAVTPRNEDWVDYYFSWGASEATHWPGLSDMLVEGAREGFLEDKMVLEGQWTRMKNDPSRNKIDIANDAAGNKMLRLLDRMLADEMKTVACAQ